MFDYTKMVFEKTVKDIKSVAYYSNVATQVMYLIYLVYALVAQTGLWYVNAALLALSLAYFVYFLHVSNHKNKDKLRDKKVKKLYTRIKQAVKLFPLAVALYSLCLTVENVNPFTLISTAFMLIGWLLQLIFDVLSMIVEKRFNLFKEAIEADFDNIKKPVKSVENFLKKVTGQEIEEQKPSKQRLWLDEQITDYKERQGEKKEQARQQKREHAQKRMKDAANKLRSKRLERKLLQKAKRLTKPNAPELPAPSDENGENQ